MALKVENPLFPQRQEILTNYDYFDIAKATGYERFYGGVADNGEYFVASSDIYSEIVYTQYTISGSEDTLYFEQDFDIEFNLPRIVKGKSYVAVPIGTYGGDPSGNSDISFYVTVIAYHYDGSTETQLATGTSRTYSRNSFQSNDPLGYVATCILNISQTHFKKGETLRFTVKVYASENDTYSPILRVGHDPGNRFASGFEQPDPNANDEQTPTTMMFDVPFKLDI